MNETMNWIATVTCIAACTGIGISAALNPKSWGRHAGVLLVVWMIIQVVDAMRLL